MTRVSAAKGNLAVLVGTVVAVVASLIGFVRELHMACQPPHSAVFPMQKFGGMPLQDMPEMFIAIAGVLLVTGGLVATRTRIGPLRQPMNGTVPLTSRSRVLIALVATAALTIDISKTSAINDRYCCRVLGRFGFRAVAGANLRLAYSMVDR